MARISIDLLVVAKDALINYLQRNQDIFTWSLMNLIGVDQDIMKLHLHISANAHLIKQKRCHFNQEKDKVIREEVQKLLEAKNVRDVQYPT